MWKKRLHVAKDILTVLGLLATVLIPLYSWMNNTLDNFSRGLLWGTLTVVIVMVVIQFTLDLWIVNITEAETIALDYLNAKEKFAKSIDIDVKTVELTDDKWHVSGKWVPKDRTFIVPGSPKLGDPNLGKEFEILIGSRTGRIIRYSSSYAKPTVGRSSDEK